MARGIPFIVRALAVMGLLCLPVFGPSGAAWAAPGTAFTVGEVIWTGGQGLDSRSLAQTAGLTFGARFDSDRLAEAVRALSRLPDIRQVTIQAEEEKNGQVTVRVDLIRARRVGRVTVSGTSRLGLSRVIRAARLNPGDEADPENLAEAARRVRTAYAREGFLAARVAVNAPPEGVRDPRRVPVHITVNEGDRARIREIRYPGMPMDEGGLPLVKPPGMFGIGRKFTEARIKKEMERVERRLAKLGYLHPQVGPYRLLPDGRKVDVVIPIQVREQVRVEVSGNRHFSDREILDILDFPGQRTLNEATLEEARARLVRRMKDDGYRNAVAEVRAMRHAGGDTYNVRVNVREGRRFRVADIHFFGNRTLKRDDLLSLVSSKWRVLPEPVREASIASRSDRIEGVMAALGFAEAEVTYAIAPVPGRSGLSYVDYHIDEGRSWWIESMRIEGDKELPAPVRKALGDYVAEYAGTAYRRNQVRAVRAGLASLLAEHGYADAEVEFESTHNSRWRGKVSSDGTPLFEEFVDISFNLVPGPQVRVGEVSVEGTYRTRPYVIQREIEIKTGDLLTPSAVSDTRRQLFRAAAFEQVRIGPVDKDAVGTVRDMRVHLVEGHPGAVELGLGYGENDGVRGLIDISYRDMFRRGHRGSIRYRVGDLRQALSLNYGLPWVGPWRAKLQTRLLYEKEDLVSFEQETRAAEVGVRRDLSENVLLSVIYRLEHNRFPRLPADQLALIPARRKVHVGSILTSLVFDTRDDPFVPRKGAVIGASYEQGARALASETQFAKAIAHMAAFKRLRRNVVLAGKVQTGRVRRLFDSEDVPISERFFLGGQSTVRGYPLDSLGVPGETLIQGVATGGRVMMLTNVELRLGGKTGWGMVLFADAGNVWSRGGTIGAADFEVGAGPGLHYATPIGPLRLDLGYKIDPDRAEERWRLHFTLGHTF
ncbi:MAG: POTRA domain-containing protein [Leptospirillia bacterium]